MYKLTKHMKWVTFIWMNTFCAYVQLQSPRSNTFSSMKLGRQLERNGKRKLDAKQIFWEVFSVSVRETRVTRESRSLLARHFRTDRSRDPGDARISGYKIPGLTERTEEEARTTRRYSLIGRDGGGRGKYLLSGRDLSDRLETSFVRRYLDVRAHFN